MTDARVSNCEEKNRNSCAIIVIFGQISFFTLKLFNFYPALLLGRICVCMYVCVCKRKWNKVNLRSISRVSVVSSALDSVE